MIVIFFSYTVEFEEESLAGTPPLEVDFTLHVAGVERCKVNGVDSDRLRTIKRSMLPIFMTYYINQILDNVNFKF